MRGAAGARAAPAKTPGLARAAPSTATTGQPLCAFSLSFQKVRVFQHPPDPVQEPLGADHAVQEHDSLALSPVLPG